MSDEMKQMAEAMKLAIQVVQRALSERAGKLQAERAKLRWWQFYAKWENQVRQDFVASMRKP